MDHAFSRSTHDRAAHLRTDDQWRSAPGPLRILVIGGEHVATTETGGVAWIVEADLAGHQVPEGEWIFLGYLGDVRHAALVIDRVPAELRPTSLRMIGPEIDRDDASLAVHAVGITRWHERHRFCPSCGAASVPAQAGHVRVCAECGTHQFPRTDPAVIMLITDDQDRALLGRQPSWPEGRFSTLAGFVEPGEALEDAVRREVMEEVGVRVGEVRHAGSQPWPFPQSLMVGYFGSADHADDGAQIRVDQDEIAEARWFTRDEVTEMTSSAELLLPPNVSISRALIQSWHGGTIHGRWA
ncbi:NAD(+) diphosphatase [Aeromicrobium sp. CF3.5]|uniref:NAD(+) diphosphatase n=1 Tax=Aeromicrobium sp. CF3.5 TaxID=3373078 RepID=UPI003EE6ADF0